MSAVAARSTRTLGTHGTISIARGTESTCCGSIFTAQVAWPVKTAAAATAAIAMMRQESHATVADANMSAYRLGGQKGSKRKIEKEYDDDGEPHIGQRLLGCLTKVGACDVAVVVSRVFGGENIGKRRFEITCDRATVLLEAVGHVPGEGIRHNWGDGHSLGGAGPSGGSSSSGGGSGGGGGSGKKRKSSGATAEEEAQRRAAQREAMALAAERRAQAMALAADSASGPSGPPLRVAAR